MHYDRWQRHGDPSVAIPNRYHPRPLLSMEQRAWKRVDIRDGCWQWRGATNGSYGIVYRGGADKRPTTMAHRVIHTSLLGPIPTGMTLDHLCLNTRCVRPDHLEPVSLAVNVLRGSGWGARNARKTHCPRGHMLPSPRHGKRECFVCVSERRQRRARVVVTLRREGP